MYFGFLIFLIAGHVTCLCSYRLVTSVVTVLIFFWRSVSVVFFEKPRFRTWFRFFDESVVNLNV